MVNQAEVSLQQWLNLTLAAGGVLVVFGIIVSMLGGLRRSESSRAMPFVTDIAGPQRPSRRGRRSPPVHCAAPARSTPIRPAPDADVDLRAPRCGRDCTARRARPRRGRVRAHLSDRVIDDIAAIPARRAADTFAGQPGGPGFRSTVGKLFPEEVQRAGLLHLLLDDWVGAALVSGYGVQHAAINWASRRSCLPVRADHMAGICAGFAGTLARAVRQAQRHHPVGARADRATAGPAGWHTVEPLRPHGMRRFRTLDLGPEDEFAAHFRDSHVDGDGVETIVHEYTVEGSIDASTRTITSVTANVRVLPWQECPGAIGSAARIRGMTLSELRDRVRGEFVGTTTCTHLNDTLRAVADLDALLDLRAVTLGLDDV